MLKELEDILMDTEYTLYVLSQEIPGDAKEVLPQLKEKLLSAQAIDAAKRQELVAHVDAALAALMSNHNYLKGSWHLWKVHRALTGRSW